MSLSMLGIIFLVFTSLIIPLIGIFSNPFNFLNIILFLYKKDLQTKKWYWVTSTKTTKKIEDDVRWFHLKTSFYISFLNSKKIPIATIGDHIYDGYLKDEEISKEHLQEKIDKSIKETIKKLNSKVNEYLKQEEKDLKIEKRFNRENIEIPESVTFKGEKND